jgi:hypothetical protein
MIVTRNTGLSEIWIRPYLNNETSEDHKEIVSQHADSAETQMRKTPLNKIKTSVSLPSEGLE